MEKAYIHYTVDDFIADEDFQRWVKFPDRGSNAFWRKWIADHPEKRDEVMKASAFISHLQFHTDSPPRTQVETALAKSLQRIEAWEDGSERKRVARHRKKLLMGGLVVAAGLLVFTLWQSLDQEPAIVEIKTAKNEIKTVQLPDGSAVTLNGNSSLKYTSDIKESSKRELWLQGEGFFDVKHIESDNESRQFIVHSGELNVEVVGTTFNIKKRADVYNVSLNSGNIRIRLGNEEGSVIVLKPGDFFQYSAKEKFIVKKKVKPELYSQWKEQKLVLDNAPLTEIAALIEDTYGYHTIIEDEDIKDDKISGTILLKDEDAFLQALSFALNIDIIKKDKDLLFKSKTKTR